MNAVPEPVERYRRLIEGAAPGLPGRHMDWLDAQRAQALEQFVRRGFPTRKDEAWRYTGLDKLLDEAWTVQDTPFTALTAADIEEFVLGEAVAARLVFANGLWVPELSDTRRLAAAVRVGSLHDGLEQEPGRIAPWLGRVPVASASSFAALNTALINDGVWIHIPAGTRLEAPIEILHLAIGQDEAPAVQPRNLIVLEDGAEAVVIEQYASLGQSIYFTNSLSEVHLGAQARLEHLGLQDESPAARHISNVFVHQGEDSHYRGLAVSLGGAWSRTEYHNRMASERARCELDGLYVAGDGQLNDFHLDIAHAVPACSSRERFKGIVLGRGRAVFDGCVRVEPQAQQSDARLSSDSLLLSRDAEVDAKPQLEIYADDVQCSHGTTVGQLEPLQLFYLRSRGIAEEDARRLLCLGFAASLLDEWGMPGFRARVETRLQTLIAEAGMADAA